jgi:hypothetical protein
VSKKGRITAPMWLTPKQLETVRAINKANREFWAADCEQFEQLQARYPDAHAQRLMEAARAILKETGTASHVAAVRAAEAVETVSRRVYAQGRQRANTRSKAHADKETLEKFHAWEKKHPRSVAGLDTARRVKTYCDNAAISDREVRRIRRLLKTGKISACTRVNGRP